MELFPRLPSLRPVKFVKIREYIYIEYVDLISFLEKHRLNTEPVVQKSNILKEIRNHKDGITEIQGKRLITANSFIRFISKHCEQYSICSKIISELSDSIFIHGDTHQKENYCVLDLYTDVSKLESVLWQNDLLKSVKVPESRTLYTNYKGHFSELEWKKICIFEYHFSQEVLDQLEYEEELSRKQEYLSDLSHVNLISKTIQKKCEKSIEVNNCRKNAAQFLNDINFISNGIQHSYAEVDKTLNISLDGVSDIKMQCVSVCCTNGQSTHGDLYVYMEAEKDSDEYMKDLKEVIKCDIARRHNIALYSVVYMNKGTLSRYSCKECNNIHRFHLHDDYIRKVIPAQSILSEKDNDFLDTCNVITTEEGLKLCETCFISFQPWLDDPLDWRCLDIPSEWFCKVPLYVQQFLSTCFLNKESIQRSGNKSQLLLTKLCKLYNLYDTALSLYNRNYSGIIQKLNTELLVVNYHSVTNVFDITASAGCTQSFKAAERWLKSAADADKSYYETFIKRYPLEYLSVHDEQVSRHYNSLRDCFVVLFMDNLVRLSVHEDPNPGTSRTSQICTLPITIKGLPRNNAIVQNWHSQECIEKSETVECVCMERDESNLSADLLTENSTDEQHCWNIFNTQITWGVVLVSELNQLLVEVQDVCEATQTKQIDISHELECLDVSMQSITLEEGNKDTTESSDLASLDELEKEFENSLHLDHTIEEKQFVDEINRLEYQHDAPETTSQTFQNSPVKDESQIQESLTITEQNTYSTSSCILQVFNVPPLLCRHPVPATGKDDDITNLSEILNEILQRLGRTESQLDRILFAPDHKISKNLLRLMKKNPVYRQFLPEFPALHLRKSKIVNLFSANKNAGLLHMLKYMKDDEQEDDWMKLITMQNIETATQNIKRLSVTLHLALFVKFYQSLRTIDKQMLLDDIKTGDISMIKHKWGNKLAKFVENGSVCNSTFALHIDFMKHCDEIIAIALSEKIGGKDGYNLLLASVKSSLPFAFLNGASSYAAFCVDLLHEHYTAGHFHKNLKMTLFSTPHKDGHVNVALDTQREMDHKDAVKGFRPRSTLTSVIPRMTIVDHFTDAQNAKASLHFNKDQIKNKDDTDNAISKEKRVLQIDLTARDWTHITPLCKLVLRVDAFSSEECFIPQNVYDNKNVNLPCEILDVNSYGVGKFLIKKYASKQEMFNLTDNSVTDATGIDGPAQLIKRARSWKSITMRRISNRLPTKPSSDRNETKRISEVKKKSKVFDCLSSSMNTCQSLVNPDCTKPPVQKSTGIRKALLKALASTYKEMKTDELNSYLKRDNLLLDVADGIPRSLSDSIKYASLEFAGIKFKTKATSGIQYMNHIENGILKHVQFLFKKLSCIVICEEKYSFTPDDFKSQTRVKRQKAASASIAHLKYGEEILSDHKMSKSAVICTSEGKRIISNYLARNICQLNIKNDITMIVDSELLLVDCNCSEQCQCPPYAMPVKVQFSKEGGYERSVMAEIKQRKGEAELAQVDWLQTFVEYLGDSDSIVSIVTSGDIDSVIVHMFALSLQWPRNPDGRFRNSVYILLQKAKPELYNITGIIERIEMHFRFKYSAVNVATICCMGGNDFIPKMNGITHERWMSIFLEYPDFLNKILKFQEIEGQQKAHINSSIYKEVVKKLFCPKTVQADRLTMEEVRQLSIKIPGKDFRHPSAWMPPNSALECLVKLLDCQVEYYFTVGDHAAQLPDFLSKGCLSKTENGLVFYEFGPSSKTETMEELLTFDESLLNTRLCAIKKNKRSAPDQTPEKCAVRKRRPLMSTPIKMKGKLASKDNMNT